MKQICCIIYLLLHGLACVVDLQIYFVSCKSANMMWFLGDKTYVVPVISNILKVY